MNKLFEMKLSSFAKAYKNQEEDSSFLAIGFDERLSLLVDAEWDSRRINKRTRLLRSANFSVHEANILDVRYDLDRNLDKSKISDLSSCKWIAEALNVIITGSTGAGKSWLSCALGVCACNNFYSVRYARLPKLLDELALAKETGTYKKWQKRYISCDLLIIDDWLLVSLSEKESQEVLEIIEARHTVRSTMLCSQYSPGGWHEKLGQGAIADAVIDRLVYNSHTIHIEGKESMRKKVSKL
jgi:DNA replication protein DnaC